MSVFRVSVCMCLCACAYVGALWIWEVGEEVHSYVQGSVDLIHSSGPCNPINAWQLLLDLFFFF
jgi:hypothetical protein